MTCFPLLQFLVQWHVLLIKVIRAIVTAPIAIALISGAVVTNAAEPPVTAAAFSASGTELLLGSQAGVKILQWPINPSVPVLELKTEVENVHHICFSPNGKQVIVAGGSPASRGVIELWSWPEKALQRRDVIGEDVVYQAIWSDDSLRWVAVSADSRCRVLDAVSGNALLIFEDHSRPVLGVAWVGAGGRVVSVGVDQTMRMWDTATGRTERTLDNHLKAIQGVISLPTDRSSHPVVATFGDDQTVRLWQPTIGRMMRFIKLTSNPKCAVISQADKQIHVGCEDGHVRSIDVDTMRLLADQKTKLDSIFEIVLTVDDKQVIVAGVGGYELINIAGQ